MSYFVELDEYSTEQLQAELKRRQERESVGLCSYCGRTGDEPTCKMFDIHQKAVVFAAEAREREARKAAGMRSGYNHIGPLGSW